MATIDHPEFHDAVSHIAANPQDHMGYLALSDWLEEHGHGHEAGALRFVLHHAAPKLPVFIGISRGNSEPHSPWRGRTLPDDDGDVHTWKEPGVSIDHDRRLGDYIDLVSPEHHVLLRHPDPTDKLIEEFRARSTHSTPQSRAYSKRPSIIGDTSGSWEARHTALSHLAYHLKTFGNAEVGGRLEKLLAKRGIHKVQELNPGRPNPIVQQHTGFARIRGSTHAIASYQQKPGAPVRLHKKPSDSFRL